MSLTAEKQIHFLNMSVLYLCVYHFSLVDSMKYKSYGITNINSFTQDVPTVQIGLQIFAGRQVPKLNKSRKSEKASGK